MPFPPNWNDPNAYANLRSTSPQDMAWQFLRRNPKYKREYREFARRYRALLDQHRDRPTKHPTRASLLNDPRAWVYEPPKRPKETERAWAHRVGNKGITTPLWTWYAKRWRIRGMPVDPADDRPQIWWSLTPGMVRVLAPRGSDEFLSRKNGKVALGFDLSLPIGPQIEEAKCYLVARKDGLRRNADPTIPAVERRPNRGSRLITLLRALDARAARATIGEIGNVMFLQTPNAYPDRNRDHVVRSTLKAAIAMRDSGYRNLLVAR